ncbi:MAG TPA: hypothetical protein VFU23_01770 [Gemmatimonadales bacterium]|nr:hypothetical protein [Gemmatimonadales bacterium]
MVINPAASTLRSEQIGDGRMNCLERAYGLARPGDQVVLLADADGVGHAVVRRPNGTVVDPNLPGMEYPSLGAWQAANPRYTDPVVIPRDQLAQVFAAPPGPQRDAVIQRLGLDGVAGRAVADGLLMPMPQWLANGQRPPWISNDVWTRGYDQAGRDALIAQYQAAWPGFAQHIQELEPEWLTGGRPPFVSEDTWRSMGLQEQQATHADYRRQWNAAVDQEMALYFGGVPDGGVRIDSPFSPAMVGGSWGQGQPQGSEWDRYHAPQRTADHPEYPLFGPKDDQVVQYLNLHDLLGPDYPYYHANLCGPLAVLSGMPGESLRGGLESLDDTFHDYLMTSEDALADAGDLRHLFELHGYTVSDRLPFAGTTPTPAELDALLANGQQEVVALVNINGHTGTSQYPPSPDYEMEDGMLRPMNGVDGNQDSSPNDISHWVRVMDVTTSPVTGESYVRVYNPFMNREEVYAWDDFQAAWSETSGGNPYSYVAATPP